MTEDRKPPEGESPKPPYVPIPAYSIEGEQEGQINLAEYILVLWRRRFLILLGTLLCALTAFILSVMEPPVYQTKATLILQPPPFATELKPAPLSVETLKTMLESDFIASQLRNQLLEKNAIQPDSPIEQIKAMLSVQIPAENEPLMNLVVEADSPQKAEIVANTWAEIFVAENASLTRSGQQATFDFIESQYPVVRNNFMDLQAELEEKQDYYGQALLRLDSSWSRRIVDFSKETERSQKEHQKGIERLRLEFISRWQPDLLKAEIKVQEAKLTKFQDQLLETEIAVKTKRDTLTQIKKEIQFHPEYLVLPKAMIDEALWDKIGDVQTGRPEDLEQIKQLREFLNPTYQNLLNRLVTTQIEYDTLVPASDHLRTELVSIRKTIDELQSRSTQKEIESFAVLKDRELELNNLLADRQVELEILQKTHESAMTRLEREGDFRVNELFLGVEAARRAYEPVAERYRSIELTKMQEGPDLKIGALAVAPGLPLGRRTRLNTLVALGVGFMLAVLLAFLLEYAQSISVTASSKREIEVPSSRSPGFGSDPPTATRRKLAGS